ncbi:site-specific integrase [Schleiferiaceae bacterium]|nr:site-specific integrase [Schleiferiaceae bacterium]
MKSDTISDTLRIKEELIAQITKKSKTEYLISFWYGNKRYRYSNGRAIGLNLSPNLFPVNDRLRQAEVLCSAFTMAIREGWRPIELEAEVTIGSIADRSLKRKQSLDYSTSYKKDLAYVKSHWDGFVRKKRLEEKPINDLSVEHIRDFIYEYAPSPASMANLKRNISALLKDELESNGVVLNFSRIKLPKAPQQLHKPIDEISALLSDINSFNSNLYLCCLMTYTMLLRPHREVRCLSFQDFNSDFSQVSLSGSQVKSKRNRILPVPEVVRVEVSRRFTGNRKDNVFTLTEKPYNRDYFKTLWSRYKRQSSLLERDQTLYSFRHTGAIKVFEKTGSLQKLQQVMGHSDMKVSLAYLRGLELKQLDVKDLPAI